MVRLVSFLSTLALASAALPSGRSLGWVAPMEEETSRGTVPPSSSSSAVALDLRGGAMVEPALYTKAAAVTWGLYGLLCLLKPDAMTTIHFNGPSNALAEFRIRGMSSMALALAFALVKMPADIDAQVALLASVLCSLVYQMNAKFRLAVKPEMLTPSKGHILPEVLFVTLSIAGFLAVKGY